jgi:hypothetical protein
MNKTQIGYLDGVFSVLLAVHKIPLALFFNARQLNLILSQFGIDLTKFIEQVSASTRSSPIFKMYLLDVLYVDDFYR